jgi:DNA-directed RNA polymerase specialized sigma24 family protein
MMRQAGFKSVAAGAEYAVASDFCRIFAEDMNGLYRLSYLLTADSAKAEQCFVSGLADSLESNRVFKEWAKSWARRTVIQNAIRMMKPTRDYSGSVPETLDVKASEQDDPLAALSGLKPFERFVFVMSVLEQLPDQDCKALLGCPRQDIIRARTQALKRIATFKGIPWPDVPNSAGRFFAAPGLVAETA